MSQEERDAYNDLYRVKTDEEIYETWTFWAFVAGGVVGLILMILLICCLIRLKNRNDLIVAKVEKLSTEQIL